LVCLLPFGEVCLRVSQFSTAFLTSRFSSGLYKIYINSFAMAAEIERDLISQRTKTGLARVKAEGKRLGNPNLKQDNQAKVQKANEYAESLRDTIESYMDSGFTQRQIVSEFNRIGVKTQKGCDFRLVTLQRIMKRLSLSAINRKKA
jgi:DNA invertase Pin-like site-specific DNA recombinase